ncbi:sensor histidine kinase [Chitinophaga polysaccharea]|uniref:ATP-binding protein n=1 Tax=Chitinophaga TaxID=79328 RepID=UPI00145528B6|nr:MULTISPECIES: tetratricopeptide repeat-containing sensor histidine kinase [Chitinophaga]NLR59186.1 sensor histidine kinase [Chitinophaga polysaccharea]NLU92045.1 sensor histidine kinase [Chitinophaga sp. Ak27]
MWEERARLSSIKDSTALVNALNGVGILYQVKNVDSVFYYGLKAKALAHHMHYFKGETDADNVIAIALANRGLTREALNLFSNALTGYGRMADTANMVQMLMNMAITYSQIADTAKARTYFHQAMALGSHLQQDSIMSLLYVNYCTCMPSLSADSINYYLDKSQAIARRHKTEWIPIMIMQMQANVMITEGKKEALPLLKESLDRCRQQNNELLEMNGLSGIGSYYDQSNPDSALKYYYEAYNLALKTGYENMMIPGAQAILATAKRTGNTANISRAHEQLENALTKENDNLKNFIGDYVKYSNIEGANKLLTISNRNKESKIWLLIGLCSICALLAVFTYRQYRVSNQLNKKIMEQNSDLQTTLTALEQSQEDNTRIMKVVAHDLRNPVGAMTTIAAMLLEEGAQSPDNQIMLDLIKTSGEHSMEMVDSLLMMHSRSEELKKEKADIYDMLRYCVDLLQFKAENKKQHIHLGASRVTLPINREKIWRVVSNLITNAIKFSPDGADIFVQMEERSGEVVITVKDSGIGIPDNMQDKIFQMFTTTRRKGTAGEHSFGLGLAISKQIVEAHKGRIWYESQPGYGTTFFVALPTT